ncbi:DUF6355 family natural product biosynthesis protein [Nonomuraea guangzhouensis]|uniref:DUF6355 family natural product biosynthesis protein n=1 Tax=Nonomuraea guangzhouensis TaxID=1291555 RepID=A0ABW4GG89_9ACTN
MHCEPGRGRPVGPPSPSLRERGATVAIRVEVVFGDDYDRCIGPGRTSLGPRSLGGLTPGVTYAYYVGRTC